MENTSPPTLPRIGQTWVNHQGRELQYTVSGWVELEIIHAEVQAFKRGGEYQDTYTVVCKTKRIYTEDKSAFTYCMEGVFDAVRSAIKDGEMPAELVYYVNLEDGYPGLVNI